MSIPERYQAIKPSGGQDTGYTEDIPYEAYSGQQPGEGRGQHHAGKRGILASIPRDALVIAVVVLSASAAFGLGLLAEHSLTARPGEGIVVQNLSANALEAATQASTTMQSSKSATPTKVMPAVLKATSGTYVASKSGKAFYLTTCAGAKRIKDENKVYFSSEAAAKSAGYSPAKTCKGL